MNDKKTVVVTGGAGGIGRAACERLAHNGWNVVAVDRDADKLAWADAADHILPVPANVVEEAENQRIFDVAQAEFGRVDAVIFNAAVTTHGDIETTPWSEFLRLFDVNVFAVALGIRAALPKLRLVNQGAIVVTSSLHGIAGEAGQAAYVASKHAVVGLVKAVARDIGCEGIRINALCPGLTRGTGMTLPIESNAPKQFQTMAYSAPLQRWGEPDEIAAAMEFLISPSASYIHGVALPVDGGAISGSGLARPKNLAGV